MFCVVQYNGWYWCAYSIKWLKTKSLHKILLVIWCEECRVLPHEFILFITIILLFFFRHSMERLQCLHFPKATVKSRCYTWHICWVWDMWHESMIYGAHLQYSYWTLVSERRMKASHKQLNFVHILIRAFLQCFWKQRKRQRERGGEGRCSGVFWTICMFA